MRPGSEAELAEMVRGANGPLVVRGGGTRALRDGDGQVLSVAGLSGIRLYEPGALTLVVGAGTPLAEVERVLAAERQRLAFEPPVLAELLGRDGASTIGGVVAANASGPRRVQAGACRDALIGVRFVDGAGTVVANGGRVMKNVTGYDLVKLLAGSHGTLGVLSEVAFKVQPIPEAACEVRVPIGDAVQAVEVMSRALSSPFDLTGAAWDGAYVRLRIEGLAGSVAHRGAALADLVGGEVVEGADWGDIASAAAVAGEGDLWRLSVRPSDAPGVLNRVPHEAALLDWGGGLVWVRTAPGTDVRGLMAVAGHATCLRGTAAPFHPEAVPVAALSAGLRARFDPRGILNPALMG
ncbi:MAG: FAD-binding protein [Shimia sp.]